MYQIALIAGITWLAVISPGPDFAMIARNSVTFGRPAAIGAALGIAAGVQVHVLLAVFGLALLERRAPATIDVIQVAGAAFLIWMGVRTATSTTPPGPAAGGGGDRALGAGVATGFLTNALNHKTFLFVASLFSQVVDAGLSHWGKLAIGLFISASHFAWFAFVAVFLTRDATRAWAHARFAIINRVIGSVLVLLGIGVAARYVLAP